MLVELAGSARVRIQAPPEVARWVRDHGGRLYVWPSHHRCCTGRLTLLDTGVAPVRGHDFVEQGMDGITVFLDRSLAGRAGDLQLALARFPRRHVCAFWDGCIWLD